MERLLKILALKRGHGSEGEQQLVANILRPYNPTLFKDQRGSTLSYVVTTDPASRTLFSSHTDTVHLAAAEAFNPAIYDPATELIYKQDGTPLGADDGAGIWLMLEMIDAGVPGSYCFHVGEERGGIGSKGMADEHYQFLRGFDRAIAFDRRGTTSVITHQAGGKCCSDEFAAALAGMLNAHGHEFRPDASGIYTDTAEYTGLIPECTNLSCGYENEHSGAEMLDVEFLIRLRDALLQVDFEALPVARDVNDHGDSPFWGLATDEFDYAGYGYMADPQDQFDLAGMDYKDIVKWVQMADARDVADLLCSLSEQMMYQDPDTAGDEYLAVGMR